MSEKIKFICNECMKTNALPVEMGGRKAKCGHCGNDLFDHYPVELKDSNFDKYIINNELPVIVDFWAPWCGPCRMMAPVFSELSYFFIKELRFAKVNTPNERVIPGRYNITSIPTMVIFYNGSVIGRISGALDRISMKNWIKEIISNNKCIKLTG